MTDQGFSLKDDLFNAGTISDLAAEIAAAWPTFDRASFEAKVLARFPELELKARVDWIAVCISDWLPERFEDQVPMILSALPAKLDPTKSDDDFGRFIHAPWGVVVAKNGIGHPDLALDTLAEITQRFSVELVIRDFINRWPKESYAKFDEWADSDNYHLRRLVSEGTRPLLPWAPRISSEIAQALPFLDRLHVDGTRYVTRSVANHLNDIAKIEPALVVEILERWKQEKRQKAKELEWMTRHATRTLVKKGDPAALSLLGYPPDPPIEIMRFSASETQVAIGGKILLEVEIEAKTATKLIVDYVVDFQKSGGKVSPKVHKFKSVALEPGERVSLSKSHVFKGNATTYRLYPGPTPIHLQINGGRSGTVVITLTE